MPQPRPEVGLAVAAQRLRMPWASCWRLVLKGELQARKVGGRWLVDEIDLRRLEKDRVNQVA